MHTFKKSFPGQQTVFSLSIVQERLSFDYNSRRYFKHRFANIVSALSPALQTSAAPHSREVLAFG